ncbi:ATP-dependent RNA helicase CshB [Salibacterium salarium]|uniref:DEAD/DEAH box helicase n=1 Tax=Salibacterium salarium TaxID=284579 RepID=UPI00277EBF46|nr:DEAD/DEAH box helicase [Salibacterium salarium]MDQ0299729.1 ATP-dependent RNA helicase CshB [Salibacterium salarium]
MKAFQRFDLPPFLIEALQNQKINKPTEIQERLIPAILNGRDVIGQSNTGSGKTLAFLLPIVARVDSNKNHVQAVITAPTRELASQIYNELQKLLEVGDGQQVTAKSVTGGTDRQRSIEKLSNQPQIIVATSGRLKDMVENQIIDVHLVEMFVVDEADQMLDMGFIEDIDPVAALMPDSLQMMVFSATVPEQLQPFLRKYMKQPRHVHVAPEEATPAKIQHHFIPLKHRDRTEVTVELAQRLHPYFAILFTSTKQEADELMAAMIDAGLNADVLHGDIPPRQRKQVMRNVDKLDIQYLVATDLAARGVDIKGVSHIINHSLPKELGYYVHRTGRTGRAGESGETYTFVETDEYTKVKTLQDQGVSPIFADLKNNEIVPIENPITKKEKKKQGNRNDPVIKAPKPKQVKPGYKKKAKQEAYHKQKKQNKAKK